MYLTNMKASYIGKECMTERLEGKTLTNHLAFVKFTKFPNFICNKFVKFNLSMILKNLYVTCI